ncbi:23S rRNA (adenine(2503)-C(2))-methyltransferase RlmN [Adlercreutzia sp. ZJ154]|uniref:23S rRNA (adenine(2503)-C(2))-methyltransferase RlmN n=1 Tax=Adlercreutzia sp. ZJ154 TaxID=2709790 RepID=UPI0013ECA048|nr:23S rRNA (adenine(2503)-C(2))-methyltransferase RlmN [Adlercreutzia sp. ZJ154]
MDIYSYSLEELEETLTQLRLPKYRAKQIYEWLHTHNVSSYDEMTNLPKALREQLSQIFPLSKTEVIECLQSEDGTRKYLLQLSDGLVTETVGIPSTSSNDVSIDQFESFNTQEELADQSITQQNFNKRLTVCFSTQIGCPVGCIFCATGKEGFSRNLKAQEIIDQVTFVHKDFNQRISNVVAMGQGEPFLNYDELLIALRRLNTDKGFLIGARHITVSTCGILDGINKFAEEPEQFTLAISLHSAIQSKRDLLMPSMKNQPLSKLKNSIQNYIDIKNRRVTFEYLMINGLNDGKEDLLNLINFCEGLLCHVNLIPLNAINADLKRSPMKIIQTWIKELELNHISATIRNSKGSDISGACGQLKRNRI